jgi:hypothetical protein
MDVLTDCLEPLDVDRLRAEFRAARPFPFVGIEPFLRPGFARAVAAAYPSVGQAERVGRTFHAVNEWGKTQVTDERHFAEPVRRLSRALADPAWLAALGEITGLAGLLADDALAGGGIHVMRRGANLDVHVDFNLLEDRKLFRRLNILVFLNEGWRPEWGGALELWDERVRTCHHRFLPELNRCVIFETSERSFHGVQPVRCPPERARRSFAAYYYTREAPAGWSGRRHSTIFRARPDERLKRYVLMPASAVKRQLLRPVRKVERLLAARKQG